jgi:hypothetical protein
MTSLPEGAEEARQPAAPDVPVPPDAPEADVQEQHEPVTEEAPPVSGELPLEATEADVTEQRQEVALDEEDAPIG